MKEFAYNNAYPSIAPSTYFPCQMSVSEARDLLEESEQRFAMGIYETEEQMDDFIDKLQ